MPRDTERLRFRRWEERDAEALFALARDPAVGPICGWPPHESVENSLRTIRTVFSAPEAYAICLRGEDTPIGCVELKLNGSTDMADRDDACELGYWLGVPYWNRGYMSEAVRELLRYAFVDLNMAEVWCGYYDGNERSKRVQEKAGFLYQWTTDDVDVPLMGETRKGHVNRITREQWERL